MLLWLLVVVDRAGDGSRFAVAVACCVSVLRTDLRFKWYEITRET